MKTRCADTCRKRIIDLDISYCSQLLSLEETASDVLRQIHVLSSPTPKFWTTFKKCDDTVLCIIPRAVAEFAEVFDQTSDTRRLKGCSVASRSVQRDNC